MRAGEGRALVLRGEPGVGKTALLDYLARRASGCRVVRAAGVQSEMELAFAGLHQLCAPMLEHAESLPGPQREALMTAFGLSAGPVPDRFLVGLAVLGLMSETAEERPLLCVVIAETHGNPLALLELPRGLTPAQLTGGFGVGARLIHRHCRDRPDVYTGAGRMLRSADRVELGDRVEKPAGSRRITPHAAKTPHVGTSS